MLRTELMATFVAASFTGELPTCNSIRGERLSFEALDTWPGRYINAVGEYSENGKPKRAAICIGPQYGTVDADLVREAAKEAAGFFDLLVVCGFAFDAYITNEFKQL